jgi:hypothetical protein
MKHAPVSRLTCAGLLLLATLGSSLADPAPVEHDPNFPIDLGAVPKFSSEQDAVVGCGGDTVVWADRRTGFFYPKFAEQYGRSQFGTFTCHKRALDADYWGFGVISNFAGKGREFPESFPCKECM